MKKPLQEQILNTLAGHSFGLPISDIAHKLAAPYMRVAGALYSASQRGHVAKIIDRDGTAVVSITPAGIDALNALDILAQRMNEKRHPQTRKPPPEPTLALNRRAALVNRIPQIDPVFALEMAKRLHASTISMPPRIRARIAKIIREAA